LKLGTWYPQGGFGNVIAAMAKVAQDKGAQFHTNAVVSNIEIENGVAKTILVNGINIPFDAVIATADYHHVENKLLPPAYRNYSEKYWDTKTFAPSCLIFYIGLNKKISALQHHTLFFDEDLHEHAIEIYKKPQWPTKPLFYVCCPSKTDTSVAPEGHENLFLLMPIAPGIEDTDALRETYFQVMLTRLEKLVKEDIGNYIDYKKSYCVQDFITDYNSYKGNAYGLANTLSQTALLKPKVKNNKVKNLFYAGQLTVPGPGVPPSIISGEISSKLLLAYLNTKS
jgi:phytoene desaturase